jgi:hypothetical protein
LPEGDTNIPTNAASRKGFATRARPLTVISYISQRGTSAVGSSLSAGTWPAWISSMVVKKERPKSAPSRRESSMVKFHHGISQPQTRVPNFFMAY